MGIAHDTGVFQYPAISPETMEAAAQLLRKELIGSEIIEKLILEDWYPESDLRRAL